MDAAGNIYDTSDTTNFEHDNDPEQFREDQARLDGYLRGRAESDLEKHRRLVNEKHAQLEASRRPV